MLQDKLSPAMAYWDKQLICRFANQTYLERMEAMLPETSDKLMPVKKPDSIYGLKQCFIDRALAGEVQIFTRLIRVDDHTVRKMVNAYYPDSRNGAIEGFFAYILDMTDMTTIEMEKAVYKFSMDSGTMVSDDDCKMLMIAETLKEQVRNKFPGLEQLALQNGISVSKLKRDFKKCYKKSPYAFFHDLKMRYAHSCIKFRNHSKKEIAAMLDFSNPATFYAAFKKFTSKVQI